MMNMLANREENRMSLMLTKAIFPEFGTKALDIPYYVSEKHMYIVDQYTTESGTRQVKYVAVSRRLLVEIVLVHYHSWTLMSSARILIPSGEYLKVVKTYEWPLTTYYSKASLCEKIEELTQEYALDNLSECGEAEIEYLKQYVQELVSNLLTQTVDSHVAEDGLQILKTYCVQMKVCRDFVTF